jgi:RecA/RadA recombinase
MKTTTGKASARAGLAATWRRVARHQAQGRTVAVIAMDGDLPLGPARDQGVNLARLLVSQPDTLEQARDIHDALRRSRAVDRCVVIGWSL